MLNKFIFLSCTFNKCVERQHINVEQIGSEEIAQNDVAEGQEENIPPTESGRTLSTTKNSCQKHFLTKSFSK